MKYTLDFLRPEYIPIALNMAHEFHKISPYKTIEIDPDKTEQFLQDLLKAPIDTQTALLLFADEKPCGLIIGLKAPFVFGEGDYTCEVMWWVDPEHRKSSGALRLLEAYEYWSKNIAHAHYTQMVALVGVEEDRLGHLYERKGYSPVEITYLKEI